jgi:hypothetical protein
VSLELFIHGPGYGETIILRWRNKVGAWEGALIDGYSVPLFGNGAPEAREQWLASRLRELGLSRLRFLAITHPHDDHLCGLAAALREWSGEIEEAWYWNHLAAPLYLEYFDRLFSAYGGEEGPGEQVAELLYFLHDRTQVKRLRPILGEEGIWQSGSESARPLTVRSIAPWFRSIFAYTRDVCRTYERRKITYGQPRANRASLGFVLTYGESQIVLGGDMEAANWQDYTRRTGGVSLTPTIVKVSHHGSSNGRIDGMWTAEGFFGGRASGALAVVTPWRTQKEQDRNLPEPAVIEEIRRAGFRVFETGIRETDRSLDSHVHITIAGDGIPPEVDVHRNRQGQPSVREYLPLPPNVGLPVR